MPKCPWLLIGKKELCNRPCRNFYCSLHAAYLRKGSKLPQPCKICCVGTHSYTQLCERCGAGNVRALNSYYSFLLRNAQKPD